MSAALTATYMNFNAAAATAVAAGAGRLSARSATLALGAAGAQAGRGMVNSSAVAAAATGMGSMGVPMTLLRSSSSDSQKSARVANRHLGAPGIPGVPSQKAIDGFRSAAGGVVGRMPAAGLNDGQCSDDLNVGGENARVIVWSGELHLIGQSQDMKRSIVAL